jgi:hypothetical protein
MNLLIIGINPHQILPLPSLFSSAGFNVTCISTKRIMSLHPFINKFILANDIEHMIELAVNAKSSTHFDLVIVAEDRIIRSILDSELNTSDKEFFLPVVSKNYFCHLGSKIGLSKSLESSSILQPAFKILENKNDLLKKSIHLRFPLMLKGDRSQAGSQVFQVDNERELKNIALHFNYYPAILQEKIDGRLISIDAFFLNSELIHFSYSEVLSSRGNQFGPSSLRHYSGYSDYLAEVHSELNTLGFVLGIHGFANISCIHCDNTNLRYYFEVDARPTVWVGVTEALGDNLSDSIKEYFLHNRTLDIPTASNYYSVNSFIIAHYLRAPLLTLITNKHSVWKFTPKYFLAFLILIRRFINRR